MDSTVTMRPACPACGDPTPCGCCVLWDKGRNDAGYGVVIRDGRQQRVHRLAWEGTHGPIPAGKLILHLCDQPACYFVPHLRIGTHADNMADMKAKGRWGPHRSTHKLDATKARTIRVRAAAGASRAELATEYDVAPSLVSLVLYGHRWRSAGGPIRTNGRKAS